MFKYVSRISLNVILILFSSKVFPEYNGQQYSLSVISIMPTSKNPLNEWANF